MDQLKKNSFFGFTIPQEYGGLELSISQEIEAIFKFGLTMPAFHALVGTNHGIGAEGIILYGTKQQKEDFLPKLAKGEYISSFALTEPESGSRHFQSLHYCNKNQQWVDCKRKKMLYQQCSHRRYFYYHCC